MTNAERNRARLDDERRLFDLVLARARRRVVLTCTDAQHDADERSARSRFVEAGAWTAAPAGPFEDPVSTREAAAAWRSQLADATRPAWQRLAALDGLVALRSTPVDGGSSATGPTPAGRSTRRSASRTPVCRTSRRAS